MAEEGQKEKADTLWDVFEKYAKYIGAISAIIGSVNTIISAVTSFFSQGSRLASYVLLFLGYLLVADFLWRVITQKSLIQRAVGIVLPPSVSRRAKPRHRYSKRRRRMAMAGLPALTLLTLVLISVSGWQDIQCWRAVVASRGQLKLIGVNGWQVIQRWCPLPIEPAQDDEILIIVSQFEGVPGEERIDFPRYIVGKLEGLEDAGIARIEKLPSNRVIREEEEAKALGEVTKATLVIWGELDEVSAAPHYEIIKNPEQVTQVEPTESPTRSPIPEEVKSFRLWVRIELPQSMLYLTEFTLGQVYYLSDQYDEALSYFNEALSALPQEKTSSWGEEYVYFYRGLTQASLGRWSRAMIDYQQAIQRNDQFAEAYNNLGVAFSGLRDYEQAIENFDLAIKLRLDVAYYNRGNAYYNQGRFAQAIADYTQAINQLDPGSIYAAYYNRGLAHAESQKHEAAIEDYSQAIERAPDENPDFYLARARSYFELCQYEDALKDLSKVIEELVADQDARVEALTVRGATYTRLGQYSEALEDYREALHLNPDYALAHYNLAATKSLEGDVDEAIQALTRAIELNPDLVVIAACDSDFDGIRDHEKLPELVPPPEGCPPAPCQ